MGLHAFLVEPLDGGMDGARETLLGTINQANRSKE